MNYKKNNDVIWTKSGGKLNVTLLAADCSEIFSFSGPSAELLNKILSASEVKLDTKIVEDFLGEKIADEDVSSLINFCLNKKIFLPA